MENAFHQVISVEELAPGQSKAVELEGLSVLVCNVKGEFLAVENRCTHQASELEGGRIRNGMISCPLHGVMFDLRTGCGRGPLGKVPLRTFAVQVIGDQVHVRLTEPAEAQA
ncbi:MULTISPECIES: Rieske 2Fe-2S domain-containing protein [Pseudomonas]|uniref:Rieske (2Fe-2S) protein n=1 Tax=Pseudomonas TaxID=286 RepID=UPI00123C0389|nr:MULTISPECIES: Rieske 2Fe-2S domain-containing protein [Pseudomonas]QIB51176.1 Rieske 2Fe-2S domain-containing protein [Pseudomonas sp. OIL-1]